MPADDGRRLESVPRGNSLAKSDEQFKKEMIKVYKQAEKDAQELAKMIKQAKAEGDFGLAKKLAVLLAMVVLLGSGNAKADPGDLHKALKSLQTTKSEMFKVTKNNYKNGRGNYTIEIGPYMLIGDYFNAGIAAKHTMRKLTDKNASREELAEYKPILDKFVKEINVSIDEDHGQMEKKLNKHADNSKKQMQKQYDDAEKQLEDDRARIERELGF